MSGMTRSDAIGSIDGLHQPFGDAEDAVDADREVGVGLSLGRLTHERRHDCPEHEAGQDVPPRPAVGRLTRGGIAGERRSGLGVDSSVVWDAIRGARNPRWIERDGSLGLRAHPVEPPMDRAMETPPRWYHRRPTNVPPAVRGTGGEIDLAGGCRATFPGWSEPLGGGSCPVRWRPVRL